MRESFETAFPRDLESDWKAYTMMASFWVDLAESGATFRPRGNAALQILRRISVGSIGKYENSWREIGTSCCSGSGSSWMRSWKAVSAMGLVGHAIAFDTEREFGWVKLLLSSCFLCCCGRKLRRQESRELQSSRFVGL